MSAIHDRELCFHRCSQISNVYERVRCCADCQTMYAVGLRAERARAVVPSTIHAGPVGRRWQTLTGGARAIASPSVAPARAGLEGAAGLEGLADAAQDRRIARAAAATLFATTTLACQALTNASDRARCLSTATAARDAAYAVIDGVTGTGGPTSVTSAEADAALEELRMQLELLEGQAEAQRAAELARERDLRQRAEAETEQTEKDSQTTLLVGGGIAAVAVIGLVFLMQDEG